MTHMVPDVKAIATLVIFAVTYLGMALGRLPFFRLDRTGIALVGASLMLAVGAIGLDAAFKAVDLNVIVLLLGMMAIIAHLQLAGFFRLVSTFVVMRAGSPMALLCGIVAVAGVLSAFLVNDAVCLIMAPLVIDVVGRLKRDPLPYLLATAMASNAGSAATLTGNPQNMIIGLDAHLSYGGFAARLAPPAFVALVAVILIVALVYRREFATPFVQQPVPSKPRWHTAQVVKALSVCLGVVIAFFINVPMAEAAIIGASLLFFTRAVKSRKIYTRIDGGLLLMFAGLFVVTAAARQNLLTPPVMQAVAALHLENGWSLAAVTALLSNLVSNVPAILVLQPFIDRLPHADAAWRIVAMSSTFAGNLTLLGSVANLIIAERAKGAGIEISFFTYMKIGLPVTLISLVMGTWWLMAGWGG
ncbi:anion transporter [Methylovirgula sp. HY1]|uniref:SLC13 family permease n=1 Tax=Methylovirgula sp. HY1 TaxID=2822761 RepID=UPI001C744CF8|nr:anion transporter [Methylovirgula sp. HY1]QXX74109.1 putative transporter [Methylovirgula sp. HY1]